MRPVSLPVANPMNLNIELDKLDRLGMEEIQLFLKGQIEQRTAFLRHYKSLGYGPKTKVHAAIKQLQKELNLLRTLHNKALKWQP